MRPRDILDGHLLFMAFRLLISATAFTAVITAFDVVGPVKAPLLILAATLTGMAFATLVAAWSIRVTSPARLQSVYRFVLMPLYMFSGTFFSADQLPRWLHAIIACTPLYQGITLCRTIAEGSATAEGSAVHIVYLVALTAFGYAAARRGFAARLRK
jgi:lipooligosaccharide transport system permease protein